MVSIPLPRVDVASLSLGVVFTGLITLAGHYIKSRTQINTSRIDDRSKLTRDLMEQLEQSFQETGELREVVRLIQRREIIMIRLLANLGGDLRVLNGHLDAQNGDLSQEVVNIDGVRRRMLLVTDVVRTMSGMLDEEQEYMETIAQKEMELKHRSAEREKKADASH